MILYLTETTPPLERPSVVCLGLFDGVHIGHQALIGKAREVAAENGYQVLVHTFDHMPINIIRPERRILELTPLPEKAALLSSFGTEIVAVSRFDDAMMHMHAGAFFHDLLVGTLRARHIVAGFHHHFGFHGEGDVQVLESLCRQANVGLSVISPVCLPGGELVSSTAIRRHLQAGNLQAAEAMLGRPWIPIDAFGRKST